MGTQVYLGIGSNLNRELALRFAVAQLQPLFQDYKVSPVYESKAVRAAEPDYYNMVVGGDTDLPLEELFQKLKQIESNAGTELMMHNGTNFGLKRRLDIDILVYGETVCAEPCKLPRHDIQDYPFVTFPLHDIAPDLVHPILGFSVSELYEQQLPHIPDNRKVFKVDFDFDGEQPNWPEQEQ